MWELCIRLSFNKTGHRATKPLEVVQSDVYWPFNYVCEKLSIILLQSGNFFRVHSGS